MCSGVIIGREGKRLVRVLDQEDGSVHRRHVDQVQVLPSRHNQPQEGDATTDDVTWKPRSEAISSTPSKKRAKVDQNLHAGKEDEQQQSYGDQNATRQEIDVDPEATLPMTDELS